VNPALVKGLYRRDCRGLSHTYKPNHDDTVLVVLPETRKELFAKQPAGGISSAPGPYSQNTFTFVTFPSLPSTSTVKSSRWSISSSRFSGLICDKVSGTPCWFSA